MDSQDVLFRAPVRVRLQSGLDRTFLSVYDALKAAMFNARIETVDTSGAFREPLKTKRCLIPAEGYSEWTASTED